MPTTPELNRIRQIGSTLTETISETSAVYAVVGATDLAVEKVRDARGRALAARGQIDVLELPVKAATQLSKVAERAQRVNSVAMESTRELSGRVHESYDQLADRGHRLVTRVRGQKSTQELLTQASSTVSRGKGAVTSVRRAAVDTRRSAKATATTARRDATRVTDDLAGEARTAATRARRSTTPTTSAAKRTATTARKRTSNATRSTKAAATSARKTAAAAEKAVSDATTKVGD